VTLKLDRRTFLKLAGAATGSAALERVLGPLSLEGFPGADGTRIVPVACNTNCGGKCRVLAHVRDGVVVRISTEGGADTDGIPQLRACLRGRAIHERFGRADRLLYPMKRVGPRGEARFERVSWDEAVDLVASNLKAVVEKHGPGALYVQYGTGDCGALAGEFWAQRLTNLLGGHLSYYNSYSSACLRYTAPYMVGYRDTNSYQTLPRSRFILLNGFNPAETVFETNSNLYLARAREAGARIVVVDPRLSETAATFADEWLPIRPTTDSALFAAMAYVIQREGLQDQAFLDRYCLGFDDAHMPAGIPPGSSFRSYLLGLSDGVPKTPEWAAAITGVEAATIARIAREYATAKPAQLIQGLGPQRHAYGEHSVRMGITLACLTGNLGVAGGGWGGGEGSRNLGAGISSLPTGENGVKASIPCFLWTDAVVRGTEMTAADGVKNGPLSSNIKFIFNIASNILVNQHADINRTIRILKDESLVRFIVVSDLTLTPSARFADILLPADSSLERDDLGFPWTGEKYVVFGSKAVDPPGECRNESWWLGRVAARLGLADAFTEGLSREGWLRRLVTEARAADPRLPGFEELKAAGFYREAPEEYVAYAREIADPVNHPFPTPSGKIEIFSKTLFDMNQPSEIPAVPKYVPAWEGPEDPLTAKYPLQCIGPHTKGRTHSTADGSTWMEESDPHRMWISPGDAAARGVADGDRVRVFNDRGALEVTVRVTRRVRPGVVAVAQGAWYTPDPAGVCKRGSVNVLTSQKPTPLARGNAQHTMLVEVRRV
jgi:anaerobic dimethyl sulfoxide reductase subunit A